MAQIEGFRRDQERFHEALHRELLDFHSGRRVTPGTAGVYADYSELFSPSAIRELKSQLQATSSSFPSRVKSLERMLRFAVEQYLDSRVAGLDEEIAGAEASRSFQWNGRDNPYACLSALIVGEPDASRRRELQRIRLRILTETGEARATRLQELHSASAKLGYSNSLEALQAASGLDFGALSSAAELLLAATETAYRELLAESLGMLPGLSPGGASAADAGYWETYNEPAGLFPGELLRPALVETFRSLGVEPEPRAAVIYDLDPRKGKATGFMCIPVRIPEEVHVLGTRGGGRRDYACLMHEGGHAHHFAWTSGSLAAEFRFSGDRSLCEAFGFVFEDLTLNESWLIENLGFAKPRAYLRFQALLRCYYVRREIGKLRFLTSLHGEYGATRDAGQRYSEIMKNHTGLHHDSDMWLPESADGFRCAAYLRGWMLSAALSQHLRLRFGTAWHRNRSAGNLLKEVWETGQLYSAEELSGELGLGSLDAQVLADDLHRGLSQ